MTVTRQLPIQHEAHLYFIVQACGYCMLLSLFEYPNIAIDCLTDTVTTF